MKHKGVAFRVLLNGEPVAISDSLRLHYEALLQAVRHSADDQNDGYFLFFPPISVEGGSTLTILMKAGEFGDFTDPDEEA